MLGHCVKCQKEKLIKENRVVRMKCAEKVMKGVCSDCSTVIYKVMEK